MFPRPRRSNSDAPQMGLFILVKTGADVDTVQQWSGL